MKKPPLVECTWKDAWTKTGDLSKNEAVGLHLIERTTIGYFVSKDETETRIAHTWDAPGPANDEESFCDVTVIWTPCVVKLRYIERGPKKEKFVPVTEMGEGD